LGDSSSQKGYLLRHRDTIKSFAILKLAKIHIHAVSVTKEDHMGKLRIGLSITLMIAVLVVGAGSAMAAPLKTNLFGLDGLFIATSGKVIPAGTMLVSSSVLIVSDDNVDGTTVPVSFTYGASSDIEVAAAFEVYKSFDNGAQDDTGTGDLFLSAKYAILEANADYPATALGLRLKLPMADDPLGTEETDFAIFAAMEMAMKSVTAMLNVEYLMPGGNAENQVNYVVGLQIPYSDTTDFSLELMDNDLVGDLFAGGATFDMGSALNFGVALGFGLNDFSADFAALGKLTFTF